MAQAGTAPITSAQLSSRWAHAVSAEGADNMVRLSGALRAIAELCWDGEGTDGDAAPRVNRGDLSALLWLVQGRLDAHVNEVMGSIEETN